MKIRILFRQIQRVPTRNAQKQGELEHRSDLAAVRLGLPLPTRYRPFTGNLDSRMRIHEREYESIADFTRLHVAWLDDPECQQISREWGECHEYERSEILYVDDNSDPIIPWIQMAAEPGRTIRYTVNPNFTMADDQAQRRTEGE